MLPSKNVSWLHFSGATL